MHGTGFWFDFAGQTKRQGEWKHGKRTVWVGKEIEAHVSGFGESNGTKPFVPRKTSRDVNKRTGQK